MNCKTIIQDFINKIFSRVKSFEIEPKVILIEDLYANKIISTEENIFPPAFLKVDKK
jgi:hypothetical protein